MNQLPSSHREIGQRLGVYFLVPGIPGEIDREWTLTNGLVVRASDCDFLLGHELAKADAVLTLALISAFSSVRFSHRDELQSFFSRYNLHRGAALRDCQFVEIIRRLLARADRDDWSGVRLTPSQLITLCEMVTYTRCQADRSLDSDSERAAWMFRVSHQQFWDQTDIYAAWYRGLFLTHELLPKVAAAEFPLNERLESILGLPFDSFLFLGFGLFAETTSQPGRTFGPQQFIASSDFAVDADTAHAFFDNVGTTFENFRTAAFNKGTFVAGFEPYSLTPLLRWPAIEVAPNVHSVPIPRLLLTRLTTGIYYDLLPRLNERERGYFGSAWGEAFETYIGELIDPVPGLRYVSGPIVYDSDGRQLETCDWMLRSGKRALLLECKTRGMSPLARITGAEEHIRASVVRADGDKKGSSLAGGLCQLMATKRAIEQGAAGLEPFQGVEEIFCVLVTLDPMYECNHQGHFQRVLSAEASRLGRDLDIGTYQVTDIEGLEDLFRLCLTTGISPLDWVARKVESEAERQKDFQLYFPYQTGGKPLVRHPLHEQRTDSFVDELVEAFRK